MMMMIGLISPFRKKEKSKKIEAQKGGAFLIQARGACDGEKKIERLGIYFFFFLAPTTAKPQPSFFGAGWSLTASAMVPKEAAEGDPIW